MSSIVYDIINHKETLEVLRLKVSQSLTESQQFLRLRETQNLGDGLCP